MEKTFTKNGKTQTTSSAERAVRLRFEGWREVTNQVPAPPDTTGTSIAGSPEQAAAIPPKGGAGSGVAAWLEYADQFPNVDMPADPTREQVIEALDDAGIPTE